VGAFLFPLKAYKFIPAVRKCISKAIVQETPFVYDKDRHFFIFDCEAVTITFWNIIFAYGSVSLKS
jgi:hypothetical protein